MKKTMLTLVVVTIPLLLWSSQSQQEESDSKQGYVKVCQGHQGISGTRGREYFQNAKRGRESWEEEMSYDRSIKTYKTDFYYEDPDWVVEWYAEHVDDYPKCDNYILMEVSKDKEHISELEG